MIYRWGGDKPDESPKLVICKNASFHCVQTAHSQFGRSSKAHFYILPASGTLFVGTPYWHSDKLGEDLGMAAGGSC